MQRIFFFVWVSVLQELLVFAAHYDVTQFYDQYNGSEAVENEFFYLSSGLDYTLGILEGGVGVSWGDPVPGGVLKIYPPRGDLFAQIEAGYSHSCGITYYTKKVVCWGRNAENQLHFNWNEEGVVMSNLSLGAFHSCGISTVSKLYCWGLDIDDRINGFDATLNFTKVSVGAKHACALDIDQHLSCWGRQDGYSRLQLFDGPHRSIGYNASLWNGETHIHPVNGSTEEYPSIEVRWTDISCGVKFCCGILTNETLAALAGWEQYNNLFCFGEFAVKALVHTAFLSLLTP